MWTQEYCYGVNFEMMIENGYGVVMIVVDEAGGGERMHSGWPERRGPVRQAHVCSGESIRRPMLEMASSTMETGLESSLTAPARMGTA